MNRLITGPPPSASGKQPAPDSAAARRLARPTVRSSASASSTIVDRTALQRLQAFEDAIAYRTARLATPCPDCRPHSALCDDHATDLSLIADYRSQCHQIATRLRAQRQP